MSVKNHETPVSDWGPSIDGLDMDNIVTYVKPPTEQESNWDDVPDLLYTYHFGANEDQCAKVGWFDFDTHTSALSDFQLQNGFLALSEQDGEYVLFRAERDADLETGTFGLTFTQRIGTLIESRGRLILVME